MDILYETEIAGLAIEGGRFRSATLARAGATREVRAKVLVAAAGPGSAGFAGRAESASSLTVASTSRAVKSARSA